MYNFFLEYTKGLRIIVLSKRNVYKSALALTTYGEVRGWFNSNRQYIPHLPPPLPMKESGLLANQTTKVSGSSFDPKVGVGPDGAQQLANVGGCVTKAPSVTLLPNLPGY